MLTYSHTIHQWLKVCRPVAGTQVCSINIPAVGRRLANINVVTHVIEQCTVNVSAARH